MVGDVLGPDGLSKNWIVNFIPDHIAGASYYAMFFILVSNEKLISS